MDQATAYGQSIAQSIRLSLENSANDAKALKYVYLENGDSFFDDFSQVASRLMEDNSCIGSMYIAPNAVIQVAYPESVGASTIGFEMLKDPDQGPKAQLAIDTKVATVAGPHALVEGGTGFIIRDPLIVNGQFVAFAIVVLDWDKFVQQVLSNSSGTGNQDYNFAVWKEDDDKALVDDQGYIFKNTDATIGRAVDIPFRVPNDTWHLVIEPKGGWYVWRSMMPAILLSSLAVWAMVIGALLYIIARNRDQRLQEEMRASQAKSTFLFNMSHDIRTPMNAILGYTELIERSAGNEAMVRGYASKMKESGDFLLSLINNVLEMARIESGSVELSEKPFDVRGFMHTVCSVFEAEAKKKNIALTVDFDVQHDTVWCDDTKLQEIYLNLVSNAIKYTPEGGAVSVVVREVPVPAESSNDFGEGEWSLFQATVSDTGIGMSEDFLPVLFDSFSRERTSTEAKVAGTGLGMSIVKRLVELMRGTIQVESEVGKGSVFTVTIPHRIVQDSDAVESGVCLGGDEQSVQANLSTPACLQGKRVLLAEDNDLNAEIACTLLEAEGLQVDRVTDGAECIATIEKRSPDFYDVILMDIQMPNMDGYEATRIIRKMPSQRRQIPIIAMTANAFEEDRERAFNCGMNDHVAKPIQLERLLNALVKHTC